MNKFFQSFSIKAKLLTVLLCSSLLSLFLAGIILTTLTISDVRKNNQKDLLAMAKLIANRSTAALSFDDVKVARENLQALNDLPVVEVACLYGQDLRVFAVLQDQERNRCPTRPEVTKVKFDQFKLEIYEPVRLDDEVIGGIYVLADLTRPLIQQMQYIAVVLFVLLVAALVAFIIVAPLLNRITTPIAELANTAYKISHERDYSHRAIKHGEDEVGVLVDAFNTMIATVEHQNQSLVSVKNNYLALYDNNPNMVFHLSLEGIILSVNRFGARLLELKPEHLHGCSIFDFVHPEDIGVCQALFELCQLNPNKVYKEEIRKICQDGRIVWVRESARLIIDTGTGERNLLLVCEDVTEARELTEKIAYQASHDALTGLVNRAEFDLQLQRVVSRAQGGRLEHALCYLDLDQFKVVNDTSGHMAGDELLRQLGELLKRNIRQNDLLARLGGDEFGILMYECSLPQAKQVCEKLRNAIRDFQFCWEDRSFSIGVSIGIAMINDISANSVELLKEADSACYAAKEKGRNRVHVYRPDDEEMASRQGEMQWVEKIQRGLEENSFQLFGQLIVPACGRKEGKHFETLVRYQDVNGNIIPPGAFLPAAERYNLAVALDQWVIARLFSWLAGHPRFLADLSQCSVNLSGLSLSDESMLPFIDQQFQEWQIPRQKICFEITETAAISHLGYARTFIDSLREKGCHFSLDDFGSGLSSFAYLKNLPVDYLKIDGLFVKDILHDEVDKAMVESINSIGHVMGKQTIAEFVENDEILAKLRELGVDYVQGYGIAKPVPLDEL
jgi:diguanylate cyclase (GGDEF)-like protein/PAS domain S-box-containing protein